MPHMLDTNIALHLRDGDTMVAAKVAALPTAILMSIVTRVELEGGVHRDPALAHLRKARLAAMLRAIPTIAFDNSCAERYADIVAVAGYSRRKVFDRMIAAQALVHRAALVTRNAGDFADVPGLQIEVW
ncbi:MAG: PIN domain-containing protein [Hydrogenophilaceae bacterium]|nr:PIN domain-containing protein [Hydrogenophilaceae bacterium]